MRLLDEREARSEICSLIKAAEKVRLAVAFWGDGATESLGLGRVGLDLQIVCNLDSGACNPAEIRKLMKLAGKDNVRSNPRLHAKIYWTPSGAVVGSSNASANGLALEGNEARSWEEANVLTADSQVLAALHDRYEELAYPDHSYIVTEPVLALAEAIWEQRRKSRPSGERLEQDFLGAYRQSPTHPSWSRVHFLFWKSDISDAGRDQEEEFKASEQVFPYDDRYENLPPSVNGGDFIIEVDASKASPRFIGISRVPRDNFRFGSLVFVKSVRGLFDLPAFPRLRIDRRQMQAWVSQIATLLKVARMPHGFCVGLSEVPGHPLRN